MQVVGHSKKRFQEKLETNQRIVSQLGTKIPSPVGVLPVWYLKIAPWNQSAIHAHNYKKMSWPGWQHLIDQALRTLHTD
jgi:hypothetical protein